MVIDAVKRGQPEAWERILEAGNMQGPLTLRVNGRHASVDNYLSRVCATRISKPTRPACTRCA